jgi:cytochrome c5
VIRRLALAGLITVANGGTAADAGTYQVFAGTQLVQGRAVWLENCEGCHGYGTAGAPIPMVTDDWRDRLTKSRETLYRHAIEGFFGPDDTMMPPRGGNDALSDAEVKSAVDYMATLADFYLQQGEHTK